jgi:hypothetical protein
VHGWAPPGSRCARCDKGLGVALIHIDGQDKPQPLHSRCADAIIADMVCAQGASVQSARGNPATQGAGTRTTQGAATASMSLMITEEQKRLLMARGYSRVQIADLTPQQAHEILGITSSGSN